METLTMFAIDENDICLRVGHSTVFGDRVISDADKEHFVTTFKSGVARAFERDPRTIRIHCLPTVLDQVVQEGEAVLRGVPSNDDDLPF